MQYPLLATYLHLSFSCQLFPLCPCVALSLKHFLIPFFSSPFQKCKIQKWAQSFLLFHVYLFHSHFTASCLKHGMAVPAITCRLAKKLTHRSQNTRDRGTETVQGSVLKNDTCIYICASKFILTVSFTLLLLSLEQF